MPIIFLTILCQSCTPQPKAESNSIMCRVKHYFETLEDSPLAIRKNIEMQTVIAQEPKEDQDQK